MTDSLPLLAVAWLYGLALGWWIGERAVARWRRLFPSP